MRSFWHYFCYFTFYWLWTLTVSFLVTAELRFLPWYGWCPLLNKLVYKLCTVFHVVFGHYYQSILARSRMSFFVSLQSDCNVCTRAQLFRWLAFYLTYLLTMSRISILHSIYAMVGITRSKVSFDISSDTLSGNFYPAFYRHAFSICHIFWHSIWHLLTFSSGVLIWHPYLAFFSTVSGKSGFVGFVFLLDRT